MNNYSAFTKFDILGTTIEVVADETSYGLNAIAMIGEQVYYLGMEYPCLSAALVLWEEINKRALTSEELRLIFDVNQMVEINFDLFV